MQKYKPILQLAFLFLLLSTAAHAVYLAEWSEGRFMLGPNDGLSQMAPFKTLLYEQYTSGEFFYSPYFGLGSGTFSWLSYYFSTSLIFILTTAFFFILEFSGAVPAPDPLFWAQSAVFINIIRLAIILFAAFQLFRYMRFPAASAFLGASIYGLSSIYFRHAVYWEFFADAFLWLLLLVFGAEKVFREKRPAWFLVAVSVSMFDNFYFSYVNFVLIGIYILFRLFLPLQEDETKKSTALSLFLISGLIGAGISAVSFIPAVYSFLHNYRPAYPHSIEWWSFHDNILYTSSFFVLPSIFVVLLFVRPLFRDPAFRFFTLLTLSSILLHYSPLAASAFNGFSAPQYRWEYFLSLAAGGTVAAGWSKLSILKINDFIFAGASALLIYGIFAWTDSEFRLSPLLLIPVLSASLILFFLYARAVQNQSAKGQAAVLTLLTLSILTAGFQLARNFIEGTLAVQFPLFLGVLGSALFTVMLVLRAVQNPVKSRPAFSFILITLLFLVNSFQYVSLVKSGSTEKVSEELITGKDYDDPEIRGLITDIAERQPGPFYRIGWMEGERNNTPMVQNFHGLSAYSSILNEELLEFYLHELEIDMGRESISRYATLGNRTNLHSLLLANFIILPKNAESVPAHFSEILSSQNFAVYENQLRLPFFRSTSTVFSEESLADQPVLQREHAMLTGVVLKNPPAEASLPPPPGQMDFTIRTEESTYENGRLKVSGKTGGIDLELKKRILPESDLYISFRLINLLPNKEISLTVNSYETTRKSSGSVYRTYADDLTVRIPSDEVVRIRMPEGNYELTEIAVYEETYEVLQKTAASQTGDAKFSWDGSRIRAAYFNSGNDKFFALPVPYEIGWTAEVNGKKADVLEANYAFLAVAAVPGLNEIELTYRPPYFRSSLGITIISLLAGILYVRRRTK